MYQLSLEKRVLIVQCLVDCVSIRATARIAGVSINTVIRLLRELGAACEDCMLGVFKNLPPTRLEVDEQWSFVRSKDHRLPEAMRGDDNSGSVWLWTAICTSSRLMPVFHVGRRTSEDAIVFMKKIRRAYKGRITIISDGLSAYPEAVEEVFGRGVRFAQLVKKQKNKRFAGATKKVVQGHVTLEQISTSYVERANLSLRTGVKRLARKTNAHSKKVENHRYAIALYLAYYNFCRIHSTFRVSPAMQAGVTNHLWSLEDLIRLIDD